MSYLRPSLEKYLQTLEEHRECQPGEVILKPGDNRELVYVLRSGFVKVYDLTEDGQKKSILILEPGQVFPLIWGFDHPGNTIYYYESFGPSEVFSFSRPQFRRDLSQNDKLNSESLLMFVYLTWDLMERVKALQMPYTFEKLLRTLPYIAAKMGKTARSGEYQLPDWITQEAISEFVGSTRESTSKHLSIAKEKEVLVKQSDSWIINIDNIPSQYIYSRWFEASEEAPTPF